MLMSSAPWDEDHHELKHAALTSCDERGKGKLAKGVQSQLAGRLPLLTLDPCPPVVVPS